MPESRAMRALAFLCVMVIAAVVWFDLNDEADSRYPVQPDTAGSGTPPIVRPEYMPPPFEDRMIRKPDPAEPAPSETEAFCGDANWSEMGVLISVEPDGEFRVDREAWNRSLANTRAGIASWMFYCKADGQRIRILDAESGSLLATYHAESGLHQPTRYASDD